MDTFFYSRTGGFFWTVIRYNIHKGFLFELRGAEPQKCGYSKPPSKGRPLCIKHRGPFDRGLLR